MASTHNGQTLSLEYLFTAYFEDGHVIEQDLDDISTIEPGKRSSFFDVLAYETTSPIKVFILRSDKQQFAVDLQTGHFYVSANKIDIADQNFIPDPKHPFKLIYFRETRKETDVNMNNDIVKERFYINRYFIGWETKWKGKNYQRTIAIDSSMKG